MRLLTIHTVLAATDLTHGSDTALESAVRLAKAAGATLHVGHVAPGREDLMADDGPRAEYEKAVSSAVATAGGARSTKTHVVSGNPVRAISLLADQTKADVVVLGRNAKSDSSDSAIGSTAYALITNTLVPVLVVTRSLPVPLENSLVAIDQSEAARGSLLAALSWTSALRGRKRGTQRPRLTALHVDTGTERSGASPHLKRSIDHDVDVLRRNAGEWAGVDVEGLIIEEPDPVAAICHHAIDSKTGLVVLGTRGAGEHERSDWGSVSAAVTQRLATPVLLVPPAVWRNHAREIDYL